MAGLVSVSQFAPDPTGLVVIGDEPEDFALAYLWRATFGFGAWVPSALGIDQTPRPWALPEGLTLLLRNHRQAARSLVVSSVSRSVEQVRESITGLFERSDIFGGNTLPEHVPVLSPGDLPWRNQATTHLAVRNQYDAHLTMPTEVDEGGTRNMVMPLPPPTLDSHLVAPEDLLWHIDIGWGWNHAVRGRGLDGQEVFTPDTEPYLARGRSSRSGVTYQSGRFNFVFTGMSAVSMLANPAVRDLSLRDWVDAKAREHDLTTKLSDAGHRTTLLTRMLGGREAFVDLFAGPLLPALKGLCPSSSTSREAYPDEDGVALGIGRGVLSFAGFCARVDGSEESETRNRLDAALRTGVVRRGLVLQCPVCEEVQFQTIDKLGQVWTCSRCDAPADLDHATWKKPTDGPTWFYDLHPVARHLLSDHGDVAAQLSAHFVEGQREKRFRLQSVEELEFVQNGKRQVEVDLIAYYDDILVVAECKSGQLPADKKKAAAEAEKKCRAAAWLRADRLVFATSQPFWPASTPGIIRSSVNQSARNALGPPEVHLITGLGTDAVETQVL